MENRTEKKPIRRGSFFFCIAVGLIVVIIGLIMKATNNASKKDYIEKTATVTSVSDGVMYVSYSHNDKDYSDIAITSAINTKDVGSRLTIYISKDDYSYATTDDLSRYFVKLLVIAGSIFIAGGVIGLIAKRLVDGKSDPLIKYEEYIYAVVDKVEYDTSVSNADGSHPYTIYCHYEDFNGKTKCTYELKNIYTKPYDYLEQNKNQVKLFVISKKHIKKYRFDESILDVPALPKEEEPDDTIVTPN